MLRDAVRARGGGATVAAAAGRAADAHCGGGSIQPSSRTLRRAWNNATFRGRIDRALAAGTLDIAFDHVGDFDDDTRLLHVRVQPAQGGGCWIFMARQD